MFSCTGKREKSLAVQTIPKAFGICRVWVGEIADDETTATYLWIVRRQCVDVERERQRHLFKMKRRIVSRRVGKDPCGRAQHYKSPVVARRCMTRAEHQTLRVPPPPDRGPTMPAPSLAKRPASPSSSSSKLAHPSEVLCLPCRSRPEGLRWRKESPPPCQSGFSCSVRLIESEQRHRDKSLP